jgi:hypothetical protein
MRSLFTIVVQNAFPFSQLGEVTATLTFFRSIGATVGVAVMGTIMSNGFQNALQSNMPQTLTRLVPASRLSQLQNPQVLLAPDAMKAMQQAFASFGSQETRLFQQLIEAIRTSLATAIANVFLLGFIAMLLALFITLFLREIPLRKEHSPQVTAAQPGPDRRRALLGLILALMAGEAQRPDASPQLLASLSANVNGRYPPTWSEEERARAVAQDVFEPLAITLLASSVGNGKRPASREASLAGRPQAGGQGDRKQVGRATASRWAGHAERIG